MTYNLKNEEEVKEYVKNLGTEYRFGCFSEKKPEGLIFVMITVRFFCNLLY